MEKYPSKEQIIGLQLLKRHKSINLKTGAYFLEYSPQFKPISLGKGIKEMVKVAWLFWGHITYKILLIPKYLPLLFLSIFKILASLHIYELHCFTLSLQNVEFYAENMGKKIKENNTWAWEKFHSKQPFLETGCIKFQSSLNLDLNLAKNN